jgi:hypothetical protein
MIRFLPLLVGIAPIVAAWAAYALNVVAGNLPSCMPFVDGCVSISATGRTPPGSLVFKAVLLPQGALLGVLWWLASAWLREVAPLSRSAAAVLGAGLIAAIALIVYVTFLGTHGPVYEFMRRFGIYFYFLGTVLSQLLLSLAMPPSRLRRAMLVIVITPFLLGISNLLLKALLDDSNDLENSIEWISALLMQAWFVLLYFAWRASSMAVTVRTG